MNVLYTAEAVATGDGRDGRTRTTDGKIDIALSMPKEVGGSGEGSTPEQLFAAGYASCFHSALRLVGQQAKANVDDSAVGAKVDLCRDEADGYQLALTLEVSLPHSPSHETLILVEKARQVCPSLKAVRGNIDVNINIAGD
jgi:lipoyl-dependent peroxiredoxin